MVAVAPRAGAPDRIAGSYHRQLDRRVGSARMLLEEVLLRALAGMADDLDARAEAKREDSAASDLARLLHLVATVEGSYSKAFRPEKDRLAGIAKQVDGFATRQQSRIAKTVAGISVAKHPELIDLYQGWVTENVDLIKSIDARYFDGVRKTISEAVRTGRSTRDLQEALRKEYSLSRGRAELIARDQVAKLNSSVTKERQVRLGVKKYRWSTSLDSRVRPKHVALEGKVFAWDDPPSEGHPGTPISCLPPEVAVTSHDRIDVAYRRRYRGHLTELVANEIEPVRCTPNHPILTLGGWKTAESLKVGEYVFLAPEQRLLLAEDDAERRHPTSADVFRALALSGITQQRPGAGGQFHGDGAVDEEVDVVAVDWSLPDMGYGVRDQEFCKAVLSYADEACHGPRDLLPALLAMGLPAEGFVRGFGKALAVFGRSPGHSDEHRRAAVAWLEAAATKQVGDRLPFASVALCQRLHALAIDEQRHHLLGVELFRVVRAAMGPHVWGSPGAEVLADQVRNASEDGCNLSEGSPLYGKPVRLVEVRRGVEPWSGHVHNFQTAAGWYAAGMIIVHNCRCVALPIFEDEASDAVTPGIVSTGGPAPKLRQLTTRTSAATKAVQRATAIALEVVGAELAAEAEHVAGSIARGAPGAQNAEREAAEALIAQAQAEAQAAQAAAQSDLAAKTAEAESLAAQQAETAELIAREQAAAALARDTAERAATQAVLAEADFAGARTALEAASAAEDERLATAKAELAVIDAELTRKKRRRDELRARIAALKTERADATDADVTAIEATIDARQAEVVTVDEEILRLEAALATAIPKPPLEIPERRDYWRVAQGGYQGRAYHYTNEDGAKGIDATGFRASDGRFGRGIYAVIRPVKDIAAATQRAYTSHLVTFDVGSKNIVEVTRSRAVDLLIDEHQRAGETDDQTLDRLGIDGWIYRNGLDDTDPFASSPDDWLIFRDPGAIRIVDITDQSGASTRRGDSDADGDTSERDAWLIFAIRAAERVKLTSAEAAAVHAYSTLNYGEINLELRAGNSLSDADRQLVDTLDAAVARGRLPKQVVLHRGLRAQNPLSEALTAGTLSIGDELIDPAFTSTSVDPGVVDFYRGAAGDILEIEAPDYLPALVLGDSAQREAESEVLLPRGATLQVVEIRTNPDTSRTIRAAYIAAPALTDPMPDS